MTASGTSVAGHKRHIWAFHTQIDAANMGDNKHYLVGADSDVGFTFPSTAYVEEIRWQVEVFTADATETLTISSFKGTEAGGAVYTSGALDVASTGSLTGSDTTPSSEAAATHDDPTAAGEDFMLVVEPSAGTDTLIASVAVQVIWRSTDA